jgi:hypothetical protein
MSHRRDAPLDVTRVQVGQRTSIATVWPHRGYGLRAADTFCLVARCLPIDVCAGRIRRVRGDAGQINRVALPRGIPPIC